MEAVWQFRGKYVGGVVGYNNGGTITSTGTIVAGKNLLVSSVGDAANTDSHVGGFIGLSTSGSINAKNCSASAYVYNTGNTAGGFIGQLDNTTGGFSYCYAGGHTHYGAYAGYALNTEKVERWWNKCKQLSLCRRFCRVSERPYIS